MLCIKIRRKEREKRWKLDRGKDERGKGELEETRGGGSSWERGRGRGIQTRSRTARRINDSCGRTCGSSGSGSGSGKLGNRGLTVEEKEE